MTDQQERSPDEWAYRLAERYDEFRKPHWRSFLPKKTWAHSQRVIFAKFYPWRDANPGYPGESTGAAMERFLMSFLEWGKNQHGDERTTCWVLLDQYTDGVGQLASASPEASIRVSLKALPKRAQLSLLLRLASELV